MNLVEPSSPVRLVGCFSSFLKDLNWLKRQVAMINTLAVIKEKFGADLKGENLTWSKKQMWLVLFPVIYTNVFISEYVWERKPWFYTTIEGGLPLDPRSMPPRIQASSFTSENVE